ncbi:MAG: LUD domain-containing protein, partial [Synergistaceae bacterium]|nr:LUD domain-containing protein [Synergistaceae bacterium]
MNENIVKGNEIKGKFVVESLKRRGFEAEYVSNREEALKRILEIIPKDATVGIPGTVTIREIGAMDALQERGNKIFQH